MRYIAILLLFTTTLSAQTKWRQIERSLVKWNVPAAHDSIPGQSGYAGKWISLAALLDSINYTVGGGVQGSGLANRLVYWKTNDTITFDSAMYWDNVNNRLGIHTTTPAAMLDVAGRIKVEQGNDNIFITGGNTTVSGNSNIAIGENTMTAVTSGNQNYGAGVSTLPALTTGSNNFAMGYQSQQSNVSGNNNIGIGNQSLYSNVSGENNVSIGNQSMNSVTGGNNTAVGFYALNQTSSGQNNAAIGYFSGYNNTTGNNNAYFGQYAGNTGASSDNTAIGYQSGRNVTGSGNIFLGKQAANFTATFDNRLYIDNSATTDPLIGGDFSANRVGINKSPASLSTTLHVGGDLTVDTRTGTMATYAGFDTNGKLVSFTPPGPGGIDSTIVAAGWGVDVVESPANTFTVTVDSSEVATAYDLTTKQDVLVSGTNIKTVNSNSLVGTGNVSVGTVTSIATSSPISGGTITGSGTIGLNYDSNTLTLSGSNLVARNGSAIWNADKLQNTNIQSVLSPSIGEVLTYTASNQWEASPASAGTTNLTFTGSASPYTLNSDTGTDVTIAAGTGISLTRSSNELTIASTLTSPQTWGDFTTNIQSWGSTGSFGSGKDVGIGGQPSRDFDVIGDSRLRGAIYNSSNSAGTSGQVLTSQGSSAWIWATPADGSSTNEAQTLSTSSNVLNLSAVSGSGGGSVTFAVGTGLAATYSTNYIEFSSVEGIGELNRNSQLVNNSFTTTTKVDFSGTSGGTFTLDTSNDRIVYTGTTTRQVRIHFSGSYATGDEAEIKFIAYKNGSTLGYRAETLTGNGANYNVPVSFSKTMHTTMATNDYIELFYAIDSGTPSSIEINNIVLLVEIIY
jgi:hypothetical protein